MQTSIGQTRLTLVQGDITKQEVNAIVNAANSRLAGGGGVDGAIHAAGGPEIMAQCRTYGGCPTGQAVITTAGELPAKRVIHTVGPIYARQPNAAELLASCYKNSLKLAIEHNLRTVAFPSISTGTYGYPLDDAAMVAVNAVIEVLKENPKAFDEVRFVLFDQMTYLAYCRALGSVL